MLLAALSPNVRRALSVGAAKPAPRGVAAPVAAVAAGAVVPGRPRRGAILRVRQATASAWTWRRGATSDGYGEATPGGADAGMTASADAPGTRRRTRVRPRAAHGLPCRVAARGGDTCPSAAPPGGRRGLRRLLQSPSDDGAAAIKQALRRVATARQATGTWPATLARRPLRA